MTETFITALLLIFSNSNPHTITKTQAEIVMVCQELNGLTICHDNERVCLGTAKSNLYACREEE